MPSQTGSIDLTAQVSANNNAKDYSDTVVDNLEIGGRNLIGHFNWSATTQGQGADYYTCSGNGTISSNNTDSTTWSFANCQWQLTLAAGTYQFTTEVLTPCETWGSANLQIVNSSGTALLATGSTVFNNGGILVKALTLSAETTIGIKIKPGKNAVCRFKLEKGTKVTDWTPAPEDQEALVSSINPFVIGTQTAATYAWTGNCPELSELKDGQQITYFLPYSVAGSQITASYTTISNGAVTNVGGASLTLTLANNVSSGQIPIWYGSGMSRVTSHYAYGSVLHLTYREDVTMSGTYYIDRGWFADANYNTDTVYSRTLDGGFITGLNGAGSYSLHMKDANGNWTNIVNQYSTNNTHTVYTGGFKFDEVLYNSTWYTNGIVTTSGTSVGGSLWSSYILDFRYSANVVNTDAGKIIARKPVYLVGTVGSDGLFYLDTTKWWTQTLPTSVDNKVYLYIGTGYDWYRINLQDKKTAYIYHDSKIKEYDEYLSDLAAQTATNYITADANGIKIHMAGNSTTYQHQTSDSTTFYVGDKKRSKVGADGLHVYVDATETEVAKFTSAGAQIGKSGESHILQDYHSLQMVDKEGSTYFHVSDLRGTDGTAEIVDTFIGDGLTKVFELSLPASNTSYAVSVSDSSGGSVTKNTSNVTFVTVPTIGSTITVTYLTTSWLAKAYTLGTRDTGNIGAFSIAEGRNVVASGAFSHAEGDSTSATSFYAHAEGILTVATADGSHAEGNHTTASGLYSHAEGSRSVANGPYSHAEGSNSTAYSCSHAEGEDTNASGVASHAEGYKTKTIHGLSSTPQGAHAEGYRSEAREGAAHAEGIYTLAAELGSHAEGYYSEANALYAHAQNTKTVAGYYSQTTIGKYNNNQSNNAFEIGNGTADDARSNALVVDWSGNLIAQGMAGMVQMFAGSTAPTGWLMCDGSAISRTTYATLFAVIGTTWGAGDGSTTFNIPDLCGRMPIGAGAGSGLTARTLGGKIGAETHNHGGNSGEVTLSAAQSGLPAHTHSFTQPTVKTELLFQKNAASGSALNRVAGANISDPSTTSTYTATVTGGAVGAVTGGAKNASSAHKHTISSNDHIPPAAVVNFIICTGKTS